MEDEQGVREANKICGVCGDRALGYNFNAVSCESCKAFFRRNALKNKDFRCPFAENCTITPVTRRFCQKCRLDRCFSVGMRKEYIMSEEDKVLKRKKIELNRAKKRPNLENSKPMITKDESAGDLICEDTSTSLPSVASGTSAVSESYFWESDKKYIDLDGNKQLVLDSLSPITAASVPSPSSPPDSCDIASSKSLEMLKDSSQNSISNFFKNDHCISQSSDDLNVQKNSSSQINYDTLSNHDLDQDKGLSVQLLKITDTLFSCKEIERESITNNLLHLQKCSRSENHYSKCLKNVESLKESSQINYTESSINTSQLEPNIQENHCQSNTEEALMCNKSKEKSTNENVTSNSSSNQGLIDKLVKNSNFIAKIIQNKSLLVKIITDPDVSKTLVSDPEILQMLGGKSILQNIQELNKTVSENDYIDKKINMKDSTTKMMTFDDENQVENPILTDLIINQNTKDQEQKSDINENSECNKTEKTQKVHQDFPRISRTANSIESILCEAIKLEYSAFSSLGGNQSSRELNDAERAKLNELIVANKALLAPLDEDITNLGDSNGSDPMLLGVINLTAIAIRRLIKMSKKISAFKNMCQEDQLALLKGGCTEMMILRSAINYDPDKEIWKIPHSQDRMANIKVDILKEAKGNLYTEHSKFVRTFDSRWRDENIILILSAIALFSPERPRVVHSDVIKLEQNSYYYLLRRYLESIYPGCEAKSTFLKLIQKMSELHKLNEEVVGVYLNVNPSSVEPLLIEIFDLKH